MADFSRFVTLLIMRSLVLLSMLVAGIASCGRHEDVNAANPNAPCDAGYERKEGTCVPHYDDCGPLAVPTLGGGCKPAGVPKDACGEGFVSDDKGGCLAVLPKEKCTGATMAVPGDTSCVTVGVEKCATGFIADGAGGCNAILPKESCGKGSMATPGETSCHPISTSCGSGTFGDVADASGMLYVDIAYTGGGSDGSKSKPFTGLQAAMDAASASTPSTVVLAAGTYEGSFVVDKPISLRGRCASMVELHGTGSTGTLRILHDGISISDIAVSSALDIGVDIGAADITLDHVWVHDTGRWGVQSWRKTITTKTTVRDSLIEYVAETGVFVQGGTLAIEQSVVRDVAQGSSLPGVGILALDDATTKVVSTLTVKGSLVERVINTGIGAAGANASIEATLIRDVKPRADGMFGRGIEVHEVTSTKAHTDLTLLGSIVERSTDAGVYVGGSTARIESTVVRSTLAGKGGKMGRGVVATSHAALGVRANLTLRSSLVEKNHEQGLWIIGSIALVEKTISREAETGVGGPGVSVAVEVGLNKGSDVTLRRVLTERNVGGGVGISGSTAIVEKCLVRDNLSDPTQVGSGIGVLVTYAPDTKTPASLTLSGSWVTGNVVAGVLVDAADAQITNTYVSDTRMQAGSEPFGRGIAVQHAAEPSYQPKVSLRSVVIERSHDVGLYAAASVLTADSVTVRDTASSTPGSGAGVVMQCDPEGMAGELTLRRSLIERSVTCGVSLQTATAHLEGVIVRDIAASDGLFGDGVTVFNYPDAVDSLISSATVTDSIVVGAARVGLSVFGSSLAVEGSYLTCNLVDLDTETQLAGRARNPQLTDSGGNLCGCKGALTPCRAETRSFQPVPASPR